MSDVTNRRAMRDVLYEQPGPRTRVLMIIGTIVSCLALAGVVVLAIRGLWLGGQLGAKSWFYFLAPQTWFFLASGFVGTAEVALTSGVIALALGLLLMLGRICPIAPVSWVFRAIIEFFRGVPSLLLILFFFAVLPKVGVVLPAFWMLVIPISLAAAAVLAEVFRSGVNAVPRGQIEAALSIGLTPAACLRLIVLPQAIRFVIPSLVSQLVVVVKDTTVAYIVSYPDLMQNARVLITTYDALVPLYLVIGVIYVLINYGINAIATHLAHSRDRKRAY